MRARNSLGYGNYSSELSITTRVGTIGTFQNFDNHLYSFESYIRINNDNDHIIFEINRGDPKVVTLNGTEVFDQLQTNLDGDTVTDIEVYNFIMSTETLANLLNSILQYNDQDKQLKHLYL